MIEQAFSAGAARVEITPSDAQYLDGYGSRTTPSEGVYLPIQARALYLAGRGGEALVLTAEVLAFDFAQAARVRGRISAAAGIPAEAIILAATHTHCAPRVCEMVMPGVLDPEYVAWFEERLVEAACAAQAGAVPARAWFSRATGTLGVNRRMVIDGRTVMRPNPGGANEPTVSTLWIGATTGKPMASLTVYACHPTCRGGTSIGGDFAGYLCDDLEARGGGVALFGLGCAGDIRPRFSDEVERFRAANLAEVESEGRSLAQRVWDGRARGTSLPVQRVVAQSEVVSLPFATLPTASELADVQRDDPNALRREWAKRVLGRLHSGLPASARFEIQVLGLIPGGAWVFLAGEMVVDYALALARYEPPIVVPVGYANGSVGYVPSRRIYPEGGYEVDGSYFYYDQPAPFREDVEDVILERVRKMLGRLA